MPGVPELSPSELRERRASGCVLIDVREPVELRIAAIADAVHIPMNEIPARLAELDRDATHVIMCHSGFRSYRVAEFLLESGFTKVFNLRGGIDAWSTEIDPQVPRY